MSCCLSVEDFLKALLEYLQNSEWHRQCYGSFKNIQNCCLSLLNFYSCPGKKLLAQLSAVNLHCLSTECEKLGNLEILWLLWMKLYVLSWLHVSINEVCGQNAQCCNDMKTGTCGCLLSWLLAHSIAEWVIKGVSERAVSGEWVIEWAQLLPASHSALGLSSELQVSSVSLILILLGIL